MPGAPASTTDLWSTQAQLMPYDIVLLSCEGLETFSANPPALEAYLNAGGRAFSSHYHYAWFSGPILSTQSYTATADWGDNLATWHGKAGEDDGVIGGIIDTTLNGSTKSFAKGVALADWLEGQQGARARRRPGEGASIYQSRYNANVGPANTSSQPWITSDFGASTTGATMYFSFDTPVTAKADA